MGIIKDSLSAHNDVHRRQANTDDFSRLRAVLWEEMGT